MPTGTGPGRPPVGGSDRATRHDHPDDPHGSDPFAWLDTAARARAEAGLTRRLRPRSPVDAHIDLAGNDYLGLARHPEVTAAAARAARRWGAGATGSRLVTGDTTLHGELEEELAAFYGTEAALVFSAGYTANLAMVTALSGAGTHLVCDRHNHASLIDATRLAKASGARVSLFDHADPTSAKAALADTAAPDRDGGPPQRRLIVSDTVFSVDGDLTDVAGLAQVGRENGAALLLDDAHGLGVVAPGGRGTLTAAGLRRAPDVVVSATLSKALGAQGGAVLGPRRVVRHLVESARTFIFDTGLAPASAAGALAALRLLAGDPERAERARRVATRLASGLAERGLRVTRPDAAVVSVLAPSRSDAVAWAQRCRAAGIRVGCFRPPSVPDGRSRLRLTARADLRGTDLDRVVRTIAATAPSAPTVTPPS